MKVCPEVFLVLGSGIYESKRRAQYAAKIIRENPEVPLILSGGVPKYIPFIQDPKGKTEANYMQEEISILGLDNELFLEEDSLNTAQNLVNSRKFLEELDMEVKDVGIVDGKSHIYRTLFLGKKILPDYNLFGFPVPIFDGSSFGNTSRNLTIETVSGLFEIIAFPRNFKEFRRHVKYNKRPEEFQGVMMPYNNKGEKG